MWQFNIVFIFITLSLTVHDYTFLCITALIFILNYEYFQTISVLTKLYFIKIIVFLWSLDFLVDKIVFITPNHPILWHKLYIDIIYCTVLLNQSTAEFKCLKLRSFVQSETFSSQLTALYSTLLMSWLFLSSLGLLYYL